MHPVLSSGFRTKRQHMLSFGTIELTAGIFR